MTKAEMEEAIRNHDRRLANVEQILPTLATKEDLREAMRDVLAESKRHTNVLFESLSGDIRLVAEAVAALTVKVDEGFAGVDRRFERMERRTDERFATVDARFDRMDARFDQMDARFDRTDARFDQMDARFDQMDARLDRRDPRNG